MFKAHHGQGAFFIRIDETKEISPCTLIWMTSNDGAGRLVKLRLACFAVICRGFPETRNRLVAGPILLVWAETVWAVPIRAIQDKVHSVQGRQMFRVMGTGQSFGFC